MFIIDATNWSFDMYCQFAHECDWGPLLSNTLVIANDGYIEPCHLVQYERLMTQTEGSCEVILFPPKDFCHLRIGRFPEVKSRLQFDAHADASLAPTHLLHPLHAVLKRGDVLYIPSHWFVEWHALTPLSVCVTFQSNHNGLGSSKRSNDVIFINLCRNIDQAYSISMSLTNTFDQHV